MGTQPEHLLKKAKARDLSAKEVARMSEAEAYDVVFRLRWPDGVPTCPHCANKGAWRITTRQTRSDGRVNPRLLLRCKSRSCRKQFTVTSGTRLHSHKLPLRDILLQVFQFTRGAKGFAALSQVFQVGESYKSAFVFEHKIRNAIQLAAGVTDRLCGEVEADLVFIGGYTRPKNYSASRVDRRSPENTSRKKQAILVIRERGASGRCLTFKTKNEVTASGLVLRHVEEGSSLFIDASPGWMAFDAYFDVHTINHSELFSRLSSNGLVVTTNQAESYNSRLRRAEIGIHHRIAGNYATAYSDEMAWREVHRRKTARELFELLLHTCLSVAPDPRWRSYWGLKPWERVA